MFRSCIDSLTVVIFALIIFTEWGSLNSWLGAGSWNGGGSTVSALSNKNFYKVRSFTPKVSQSPSYHRILSGQVSPTMVQRQRGHGTRGKTYRKPTRVRTHTRKVRTKITRKKPRRIKVTYKRRSGKRQKSQTVKLQSIGGYPVVKPTEARLRKVINHYRTPYPIGSSPTKPAINTNRIQQISTKSSIFTTRKPIPTSNRVTPLLRTSQVSSRTTHASNTRASGPVRPLIREVLTNEESIERYGIKAPPGFRVVTTRSSNNIGNDFTKTSKLPTTKSSFITLPTGVLLTLGATHKPTKSSYLRIDTTSVNDAYNVLKEIGTGYRVKLTPTQALGKHDAIDVDFTATRKSTLPPVRDSLTTPLQRFDSRNVILNDDASRYGTGEQSGMRLLKQFMSELNELWKAPTEAVQTTQPRGPGPTMSELFDVVEGDTAWYNGSNVCQKESLSLHGLTKSVRTRLNKVTVCNEVWPNYICTERYSDMENGPTREVIYHCCVGYEREDGRGNCIKENTPRLLKEIGGDKQNIASFGIFPGETADTEVITFFMPRDDVVNDYLQKASLDDPSNVQNFLENHVVMGEHYESVDMTNNEIIKAHSTNPIRVNFFEPGNIMTVNCILVSQRDVQNGDTIVHVIDDIIADVTETIYEYITRNSEMFIVLRKFIEDGRLGSLLNDTDSTFTLFAPTDKAMLSDNIVSDAQACSDSFVKHHVVNGIICLSSVSGQTNVTSILGDRYSLARSNEDDVFVDDSRVVTRDIVTLNGVIHIIDSPLRSSQSRTVLDVIKRDVNATIMTQLLEEGGMTDAIATSDNFTLLVPINSAFDVTPMYYKNFMSNPDSFRRMLIHHFIPLPVQMAELKFHESLSTLDPSNSLQVQTYYTKTRVKKIGGKVKKSREIFTAVQCAKVLKVEPTEACNGNFIFINQVILPPSGSILETLHFAPQGNFSIFIRAIEIAGLKKLLQQKTNLTVFAPTNRAFAALPHKFLRSIMRSGRMLRKIILFHIINGYQCCDTLMQHAKSHKTMYGRSLTTCPKRNKLYLGRSKYRLRAQANACDIAATNGLIHGINQMLIPVQLRSK